MTGMPRLGHLPGMPRADHHLQGCCRSAAPIVNDRLHRNPAFPPWPDGSPHDGAGVVDALTGFGAVVAVISAAVLLAVFSHRVSTRLRVPAPALFLIAAAVCGAVFPGLRSVPIQVDEQIVTVALVFILFDGGMHIGWRRFRSAAIAVVWLGVAGTVVTAGALAVAAHLLFGFDWPAALLIGTALSPTDPAVVFSVLGRREVVGRSGTILEGESGANDPVGIALMISLLGATGGGVSAVAQGVGEFALQMAVGAAVGALGGLGLRRVMRLPLPGASTGSRPCCPGRGSSPCCWPGSWSGTSVPPT